MSEVISSNTSGEAISVSHNLLTIATLNINGLPSFRQNSRTKFLLPSWQVRHQELCRIIDESNIDVINFQEVFTHQDRRLLAKNLPSFGYSAFASSVVGPKGALVTFSRIPLGPGRYSSYYTASRKADCTKISPLSKVKSGMKGTLATELLISSPLTVINTHPLANDDWDWSSSNRFHSLQKAQLDELASIVRLHAATGDVILGCDLNVSKNSELYTRFLGKSGLHDIFKEDTAATFHQDFLAENQLAPCIDFLLTTNSDAARNADSQRIFPGRVTLANLGDVYLTDHEGLCTTVTLA